jgi:GH43 family beta-xylosidase
MQGVGIYVSRSRTLTGAADGLTSQVWPLPHPAYPFEEAWAPELHFLDGKWYLYVAARKNRESLHEIVVLEAVTADPQGEYVYRGNIHDESHHWMIDGTVFEWKGERYFVWSGINDGEFKGDKNYYYGEQRLYIARMINPWSIKDAGVLAVPEYVWEKNGPTAVNEGPQVLQKNEKLFISFSASHSFTDHYCLGLLEYVAGDVLKASSWKKYPEPVFCKTSSVLGPGHPSFTTSPDGTEDWIVYHATRSVGSRWKRQIHAQKFEWTEDGLPIFGQPVPAALELSVPSGEETILRESAAEERTQSSALTLASSLKLDKEDFEEAVH